MSSSVIACADTILQQSITDPPPTAKIKSTLFSFASLAPSWTLLFTNPLSKKEEISFSDLSGQKVSVITTGNSKQNEDILNKIKTNSKDVEIIDAPLFYSIDVFNKCEENGYLLVTLECWKDIHPAFKTIPLSSGESMPYGVVYSKNPSKDALRFLDIIKEVI